jgi:hypothetical protein
MSESDAFASRENDAAAPETAFRGGSRVARGLKVLVFGKAAGSFGGGESFAGPVPHVGPWRALALLGVGLTLISALVRSFPVRSGQGNGVLTFLVVVIAAALALRLVFGAFWGAVGARPDLLVPSGVALLGVEIVGWCSRMPGLGALLAPSLSGRLLGISLGISLGGVLEVGLWAAYAAWQTDLIIRALQSSGPISPVPWSSIRRGFGPALAVLALGTVVLLVGLAFCLALAAASLWLGLFAMGVWSVAWNLATAALLPTVLIRGGMIRSRIAAGLRASWRLKGRLWRPVLTLLVLMGLATVFYVHTKTTVPGAGGVTQTSETTNSSFHVHCFWVGGFDNECYWYPDVMADSKAPPVPVLTWCLGLQFLVLAVAMKWTVIQEILNEQGLFSSGKSEDRWSMEIP